MIKFEERVYTARLADRGLSGKMGDGVFLGHFKKRSIAQKIAQEKAGTNDLRTYDPLVVEDVIKVEIFETESEYRLSSRNQHLDSAKCKLTSEEYEAIKQQILLGAIE
jgi:hypothetical protein